MITIKAAAVACVIANGHFTLDKPATIDPTGCDIVRIESSYIETKEGDQTFPFSSLWQTAAPWSGSFLARYNVINHLRKDGTPFPGMKRDGSGCETGWHEEEQIDDKGNSRVWCARFGKPA